MLKRLLKTTSILVAACMLFLGASQEVLAYGDLDSVLPGGGINVTLSNGTALDDLQDDENSDLKIETLIEIPEVQTASEETEAVVEIPDEEQESVVVAQTEDYVRIRSAASDNAQVVGKFYKDAVGLILSEENGWYEIQSGNVIGYVRKDFCVTGPEAQELAAQLGNRMAEVLCDRLVVRLGATEESEVLGMVAMGDTLLVTGETQDWVRVDIEEGYGWVNKQFVRVYTEYIRAESVEEEALRLEKEEKDREKARIAAAKNAILTVEKTDETEMGIAVAKYAIQFIGNPYVWGGVSLTDGVDCSGFVMKVYEEFGVELPHSSAADRSQGYAVDGLENALPGDLICYSGHVAIYIGDGQIVHAASEKSGIKVSNADYRQILAIRRIF